MSTRNSTLHWQLLTFLSKTYKRGKYTGWASENLEADDELVFIIP